MQLTFLWSREFRRRSPPSSRAATAQDSNTAGTEVQQLTKLHDQQRASVHTDVKSEHFHLARETKLGDPPSTLWSNSLLQYIVKPLTGKWKGCNHGVSLAEHDPDTTLSSLSFADDFLLISGSLKHTTTMLDDFTTATTARPATSHHENPNHLQHDIKARKRQHGGSSRNEHRDPTARREIKYLVNSSPWKTPHKSSLSTAPYARGQPQPGVDVTR